MAKQAPLSPSTAPCTGWGFGATDHDGHSGSQNHITPTIINCRTQTTPIPAPIPPCGYPPIRTIPTPQNGQKRAAEPPNCTAGGTTRVMGTVWSHFGPLVDCFGPLSAPAANRANLSSSDGSRWGVRVPNNTRLKVLRRDNHLPTLRAVRTVALEILQSGPPACCLLVAAPQSGRASLLVSHLWPEDAAYAHAYACCCLLLAAGLLLLAC